MNDQELHLEFTRLGREKINLTHKLCAMLPEINSRKIYLKHNCSTIYEYGWRFAGLSKGLVEKALHVNELVKEKPLLQAEIAKVGIHKVAMIANLATPETEKVWAERVENMSKNALQELSKEVRHKETKNCQAFNSFTVKLDQETTKRLLSFQKKMGCESAVEVIRQLLSLAENNSDICLDTILDTLNLLDQQEESSTGGKILEENVTRYIKKKQKRETLEKASYTCSYPGCSLPAEEFHHRERFSNSHSHQSIIPLCKIHHEFMHQGLVRNETKEPEQWQLNLTGEAEKIYLKYKNSKTKAPS